METKTFDFAAKKMNSIESAVNSLNENQRIGIFNSYLMNNNYDYSIIYKHELEEYINLKKFKVYELFTLFKEADENDEYFLIQLSTKKIKSSNYLNGLFTSIASWKDLRRWLNDNSEILAQFNYKGLISDKMANDFKNMCKELNEVNSDTLECVLFDDDAITENWDELYAQVLKDAKEYEEE